jgi:hypothetical protein
LLAGLTDFPGRAGIQFNQQAEGIAGIQQQITIIGKESKSAGICSNVSVHRGWSYRFTAIRNASQKVIKVIREI